MLKLTPPPWKRPKIEAMAIPVCEDADIHDTPEIQELIAKAKVLPEFSGEKGQQVTLYNLMQGKVRRCTFRGVGARENLNTETLRAFAGRVVKEAMGNKKTQLIIAAPLANPVPMEHQVILTSLMEGAYLGNQCFNRYKEKPKDRPLKSISLLVAPSMVRSYAKLVTRTKAICQAAATAREWVSMPSNDKSPAGLAQLMEQAARNAGISVRILTDKKLADKKFNALLAVAAGSANPARLVQMTYSPPKPDKTIVLVGKGVTFDTGGINIKPSPGMDAMKSDMAGAAAVAATMTALKQVKPKHRVVGIVPLVENMPSGTATRPGDIVTSYAGKTVEIGNTDAEGRLILADAMAYAIEQYKPHIVIDLATLTGACMVALGEQIAGVFTTDKELGAAVVEAGEATYERCWAMPMPEDYKELLKSDFADLKNISSSRYGGAITAALFLSEFTTKTRWAHIDIAGPAFATKASDYWTPGGTGFGVRLLCHLLAKL
jgi:leucyl aminopeptidase